MKNKVSIALATYNGEKYIKEQLNSLLNQTILPDEIVISDNYSSDNTIDICNDFLKDKNVTFNIIYCEEKGVVNNFNNAIKNCTGDIIFFCDQDDVWYENKIEDFLEVFNQNEKCNLVFSDANLSVTGEYSLIKKLFNGKVPNNLLNGIIDNDFFLDLELFSNYVTGMSMAVKKSFLNEILPFSSFVLHDYWIAINAPFYGEVYYLNKYTAYYRQHENNVVSHKKKVNINNFLDSVSKSKKYIENKYNFLNQISQKYPEISKKQTFLNIYDTFQKRYECVENKKINVFLCLFFSGKYKYVADKYAILKDLAHFFVRF